MEISDQDLQGSEFRRVNLREARLSSVDLTGARVRGSDLVGVVMRAMDVDGLDIDAPWLYEGSLLVNGIDVVPFVAAELDRRFPGRSLRRASDLDGLREAWAALERSWDPIMERVASMPPDAAKTSVEGEWSFAQTLRHLVLATDVWLGKAVLRREDYLHPLGLSDSASDGTALVAGLDGTAEPTYAEVLLARADRQTLVRDYLAGVGADDLAQPRPNPHAPDHAETVLSCLHTILEEEWEHQRYAVRDLDRLERS